MNNFNKGFSAITGLIIVAIAGLIGLAGWYVWDKNQKDEPKTQTTQPTPAPARQNPQFADPKKSAHFESSTPAHASILATVPVDLVIDFNFDLATNSTIKIDKDGKDYGSGEVKFDDSKLAMRRQMDKNAPDGVYTVNYNACWPDRSCHDGHFQFAIDRSLLGGYEDKRNQKQVSVTLSETMFHPMKMRISQGTTVTWINNDDTVHYVNTDSHPAHTQVLGLNSKALAKGQSFSFTFTNTGAYLYHCSAHAADMKAAIVVE